MEKFGKFFVGCTIGKHITNEQHVFFCKFMHSMFRTLISFSSKYSIVMKCIFAPRDIFKIFQSVVSRLSVFMIDFFHWWTRTNEREHYKSMNLKANSFYSIRKPNLMSSIYDCGFNEKWNAFMFWTGAAYHATYFPDITDFVNSFITRNCFPNCFHTITITRGVSPV